MRLISKVDARGALPDIVCAWLLRTAASLEKNWSNETEYYPLLLIFVNGGVPAKDEKGKWAFIVTDDKENNLETVFDTWYKKLKEKHAREMEANDGLYTTPDPTGIPAFAFMERGAERNNFLARCEELMKAQMES